MKQRETHILVGGDSEIEIETERDRERVQEWALIHWFVFKMTGSQEFNLGTQVPMSHHLLPARICISWKLELRADLGFDLRHYDMQCRYSKHIKGCAKYLIQCLHIARQIITTLYPHCLALSVFMLWNVHKSTSLLILNPTSRAWGDEFKLQMVASSWLFLGSSGGSLCLPAIISSYKGTSTLSLKTEAYWASVFDTLWQGSIEWEPGSPNGV